MIEWRRAYTRRVPFEILLSQAYLDIWHARNDPAEYCACVYALWNMLPTVFQDRIAKRAKKMGYNLFEAKIKKTGDPILDKTALLEDEYYRCSILLHFIIDILTEAGLNFMMSQKVEKGKVGEWLEEV